MNNIHAPKEMVLNYIKNNCGSRVDSVIRLHDYLEEKGLYDAPASTIHHMSCAGGLIEHSLNVLHTAWSIRDSICNKSVVGNDSLVLCSLFHDVHKCCDIYGNSYYLANTLKSGKVSEAKPYVTNKEAFTCSGGMQSLMIVRKFVDLSHQESQAILYHDGQYVYENKIIQHKELPLTLILHWADMWSCSQIENLDSLYNFAKKQKEELHEAISH